MEPLMTAIVSPLAPAPKGARLVLFADAYNYVPEYDAGAMLSAAARYARRHGVFVVPGRFVAAGSLCLCLLSPAGEVLGVQRATHLNLDYRGRFSRADCIHCFDTPLGKTALLVDVDLNLPQASRAAAAQGATLLIASQFVQMFDFFEDRIRCSAVNAALSNGVAVAAAVGAGGVLVEPSGVLAAGYSEELPLMAGLPVPHSPRDPAAMAEASALLRAHRALLTGTVQGGAADV